MVAGVISGFNIIVGVVANGLFAARPADVVIVGDSVRGKAR